MAPCQGAKDKREGDVDVLKVGRLGAGLGRLPADLRKRIASVVLTGPGTHVYFHANPTGIWYRGPVAAEPAHTIPLLRGLPVTSFTAPKRMTACARRRSWPRQAACRSPTDT